MNSEIRKAIHPVKRGIAMIVSLAIAFTMGQGALKYGALVAKGSHDINLLISMTVLAFMCLLMACVAVVAFLGFAFKRIP